jgi:toxin YoeB
VKVVFLPVAWQQYLHWVAADPKLLSRLNAIIEDARRSPFRGIGKPEPLRDSLAGWWSRRITDEHRLVYRLAGKGDEQVLEILQCRFHYERR